MLTESSGGALWGSLSASAKTVAMGTAGVALWGSLAFYMVVGSSDSHTEEDIAAQSQERLFLRMELPESTLLNGCAENFGGDACSDKAWIIISENKARSQATVMPAGLKGVMPAPLWTEVVARHSMNDQTCKTTLQDELPKWLSSGARAKKGLHATLVPDRFTACKGNVADNDLTQDAQAFWIMSDEKVVAELRCTLPQGERDSDCQLSAYPENGDYVVSYSRLPSANASAIVDQSAHMIGVLAANMPEGAKDRVDLSFLDGKIVFDDASAHAVASLHNMVR